MTIGTAWIRRTAAGEELWLATDSRLSGDGYLWDSCPKLVVLPRPSTAAAFAGATSRAPPARGGSGFLWRRPLNPDGKLGAGGSLDSEPLEVLAELLRMPASHILSRSLPLNRRPWTVGGPPQLVRIVAAADATPFVV